MDGSERLQKNSRRLRRLFTVMLVLTPLFSATFWIGVGEGEEAFLKHLPVKVSGGLPMASLILGFLVTMIPTGFIMYALLLIVRLFGLYEKGMVFAKENVACFRTIGWSIIACEISSFLANIALGPILTYHQGVGMRQLVIELDSNSFYTMLAGFSVLTISWVMDEARKLKEEQELFV